MEVQFVEPGSALGYLHEDGFGFYLQEQKWHRDNCITKYTTARVRAQQSWETEAHCTDCRPLSGLESFHFRQLSWSETPVSPQSSLPVEACGWRLSAHLVIFRDFLWFLSR